MDLQRQLTIAQNKVAENEALKQAKSDAERRLRELRMELDRAQSQKTKSQAQFVTSLVYPVNE